LGEYQEAKGKEIYTLLFKTGGEAFPVLKNSTRLIQIRLVSETKFKRIQCHQFRELQAKIFDPWDEYEANQRSAKRLLKACMLLPYPTERKLSKITSLTTNKRLFWEQPNTI